MRFNAIALYCFGILDSSSVNLYGFSTSIILFNSSSSPNTLTCWSFDKCFLKYFKSFAEFFLCKRRPNFLTFFLITFRFLAFLASLICFSLSIICANVVLAILLFLSIASRSSMCALIA